MGGKYRKDGTGYQLKNLIRNESHTNMPAEKDPWYKFCVTFNIDVRDLDIFADFLGYCEFLDMQFSYNPASLYKKKKKIFLLALKNISYTAASMSDEEILSSI